MTNDDLRAAAQAATPAFADQNGVPQIVVAADRILALLDENDERTDFDAMRVVRGWPTPNHMRRTADALDNLTFAKYGDILRWFADRCDEWMWHMGDVAAAERLTQARAALEGKP